MDQRQQGWVHLHKALEQFGSGATLHCKNADGNIYSTINGGVHELHMPPHASGVQLLPNMKYLWIISNCKSTIDNEQHEKKLILRRMR